MDVIVKPGVSKPYLEQVVEYRGDLVAAFRDHMFA